MRPDRDLTILDVDARIEAAVARHPTGRARWERAVVLTAMLLALGAVGVALVLTAHHWIAAGLVLVGLGVVSETK